MKFTSVLQSSSSGFLHNNCRQPFMFFFCFLFVLCFFVIGMMCFTQTRNGCVQNWFRTDLLLITFKLCLICGVQSTDHTQIWQFATKFTQNQQCSLRSIESEIMHFIGAISWSRRKCCSFLCENRSSSQNLKCTLVFTRIFVRYSLVFLNRFTYLRFSVNNVANFNVRLNLWTHVFLHFKNVLVQGTRT